LPTLVSFLTFPWSLLPSSLYMKLLWVSMAYEFLKLLSDTKTIHTGIVHFNSYSIAKFIIRFSPPLLQRLAKAVTTTQIMLHVYN
jgi:hypothetical protein